MKLPQNPSARAALITTFIIFLATSILWLGALTLLFHLPEFPRFIVVIVYLLTFLGAPGLLITTLLHFPKGDPSVWAAIVFAWLFYFALCRWIFSPSDRLADAELVRAQKGTAEPDGALHRNIGDEEA